MRSLPSLSSLLLSLLLLLPPAASAAAITLGSSLTPTSSSNWTSANNTFSLGFIPSPTSPSLFLAAITYSGGLPIWSPTPSPVDSAGSLTLLPSGNLHLTNGSGALIWQSSTANLSVSSAVLLESGNLKLSNSTSTVWQSFEHPTDTIVQSQNFTTGQTLNSGIYSFTLDPSGNLTLKWNQNIVYYNKGVNASVAANNTITSPILILQSIGILNLYDPVLTTPAVIAYSSDYGKSEVKMRFLRLDSDGNFRAYSYQSGTATAVWSAVDDQCLVYGYCGIMGICSYNDTAPICGCPSENFVQSDPTDSRKGCQLKSSLESCRNSQTMLELPHTLFLTYPPDTANNLFNSADQGCRSNCLTSTCLGSTLLADGSGQCYLKYSNLSGYQSAALPSTSYVKVCQPEAPYPPPSAPGQRQTGSKLSGRVVAIVVIGTILGLAALESALWWFFCRNSPKFGTSSAQYALLEYASGAPVQFSYKELQRSTKGFKEKLGAGGFGAVYKGVLANRTVVAVKQLEGIEQGEKQFRMEVATISSTHHLNLVRLIGFCSEGRHRLLVYEFMKNSSLDSFLFHGESMSGKLAWPARFTVAIGTAKGITYLHEECRDCIVHCDIKPENILLDENYNAKVSDFGLAKLVNPRDHQQRTLTSVRGTRGYLAPEWLANHPITTKSDVYSYGMVLLEIVGGRRNFDVSAETGGKKFSKWAYEEFERGNIVGIMDKRLADQDVDMEQLLRAIQVIFWCIQEQPSHRPSMGKVVQMLEGIMELERPPAPKATDGSQSVRSGSSSVTSFQITAVAAQDPTLSSSFHSTPTLTSTSRTLSRTNFGRASSSLLG